jgi:hypothetical protein
MRQHDHDGLSAPDTEAGRLQRASLELLREQQRELKISLRKLRKGR